MISSVGERCPCGWSNRNKKPLREKRSLYSSSPTLETAQLVTVIRRAPGLAGLRRDVDLQGDLKSKREALKSVMNVTGSPSVFFSLLGGLTLNLSSVHSPLVFGNNYLASLRSSVSVSHWALGIIFPSLFPFCAGKQPPRSRNFRVIYYYL